VPLLDPSTLWFTHDVAGIGVYVACFIPSDFRFGLFIGEQELHPFAAFSACFSRAIATNIACCVDDALAR
jgi:hypothetical protein